MWFSSVAVAHLIDDAVTISAHSFHDDSPDGVLKVSPTTVASHLGQVAEIMMRCDDAAPAYLVVSLGGLGGVGETPDAFDEGEFDLRADGIRSYVSAAVPGARTPIAVDNWPAKA